MNHVTFEQNVQRIQKVAASIVKQSKKNTVFFIYTNDKEYYTGYTGTYEPRTPEEKFAHDKRLMYVLMANENLLNLLYRIIMPVVRCKKREAKKKAKQQIIPLNSQD